jgi:hypothetical protein
MKVAADVHAHYEDRLLFEFFGLLDFQFER